MEQGGTLMNLDRHRIDIVAEEDARCSLAVLDVFDVVCYRVLIRLDGAFWGGVEGCGNHCDEVLKD